MFRSITKMGLAAMALLVGLPLAGCTNGVLKTLPPAPKTPAQAVYEMKSGLVTAEIAAENYEAAVCPGASTCTTAGAVALNKAIKTAAPLIDTAETIVRAGGASDSAITAAQAALTALQGLVTQYAPSSGTAAS